MPTTPRPDPARRPPQAVTTARRSQDEDRRRRMRAYVIAMVIRTVSFPLAVWAFLSDQVILGWILMVAAVLIPSVAVGIANAVDHRGEDQGPKPVSPVQGLGPASAPAEPAAGTAAGTVPGDIVQGTVVESRVTPHGQAS